MKKINIKILLLSFLFTIPIHLVYSQTNQKEKTHKGDLIDTKGLPVTDGAKRNGKSIIITRGTQTMSASEEPLFIVDGFETQSIAHILPQEVNSIAIKRGTDTTEYGIKGANVVILITLKK